MANNPSEFEIPDYSKDPYDERHEDGLFHDERDDWTRPDYPDREEINEILEDFDPA